MKLGLRWQWRLSEMVVVLLVISLGIFALSRGRHPFQSTSGENFERSIHGISLGLLGYLQGHEPDTLAQMKADGQEVNRLAQAIPELSPKPVRDLRQITLTILEMEESRSQFLRDFARQQESLQEGLDHLTTLVRPNQLNGFAKLQALMDASIAAYRYRALGIEALTRGGDPADTLAAEEQHFILALEAYMRLARTSRSQAMAAELRQLFRKQVRLVHQAIELERVRSAALETYIQTNRDVVSQIPKASAAPSGARSGQRVLVILLVVVLILAIVGRDRWMTWAIWRPLQNLHVAMEATSVGDVEREIPLVSSSGEIGLLAKSLRRLSGVLARSQNLVYHLAALVELSGDAIISQDLDGTILSWNSGAQRIYGYSAEEVKGWTIRLLSPQDEGAQLLQILDQVKTGKRLRPVEMLHLAKNGRTVHAFVRVAAIFDSQKRVIGASLCAQEITSARMLPPAWIKTVI